MNQEALSHHGDPVIYARDLHLLKAYQTWVKVAHAAQPERYPVTWAPTEPDILKSRLFWRLRSGKDPLPFAPPTSYSCPWYEVVEEDRPHYVYERISAPVELAPFGAVYPFHAIAEYKLGAVVAQCLYGWVRSEGTKHLLAYGPYRFWAWNGMTTWATAQDGGPEHPCGYIQRAAGEEPR